MLHVCVCESRSVVSNSLRLHGLSVHGILQASILEWVAIPFSRGSSWPRDWTQVSHPAGRYLPAEPPGKPFFYLYAAWVSLNHWTMIPGGEGHGIHSYNLTQCLSYCKYSNSRNEWPGIPRWHFRSIFFLDLFLYGMNLVSFYPHWLYFPIWNPTGFATEPLYLA